MSDAMTAQPPNLDARFWIGFLTDEPDEDGLFIGRIVIGRSRDGFGTDQDEWTEAEFVTHWREALLRLGGQASSTVLVTHPTPFAGFYVLYREGDRVYVQERLLIREEEHLRFRPEAPYAIAGPRQIHGDDGDPLTWECSYAGIEAFLGAGGPQLVRERTEAPPE